MHWHSCPRKWWSHHPCRCSRTVVLRNVVSGHGGGGATADDLSNFSNLYDLMIINGISKTLHSIGS